MGLVRPPPPDRGPLAERGALRQLFDRFEPDLVFHLASAHHSSDGTTDAALQREMEDTNFRAAERLAATIAEHRPGCRLLLAGSSQMYPAAAGELLLAHEATPMHPSTVYGRTKAASREMLARYREQHGVFGVMTILFNH